jgi:tRNA pseudouridine55 synthase
MVERRRERRFSTDGVLVVDKPQGISSAQVVGGIKRLTGPLKIGHAGTLDPFATGVLVVCFNQATKLAGYLTEQDKLYEGVLLLGVETDTQDPTGRVVKRKPVQVTEAEVEEAAESFRGLIRQRPPAFSALKRNGEPLYKKARRGERVEVEPREVTIHSLRVTSFEPPRVSFEVLCSKGTYIRTLAHDWGRKLGCGGHLEQLRRTASGRFTIEQALILGQVEATARRGRLGKTLIPPEKALDWPGARLGEEATMMISQGRALTSQELGGIQPQFLKVGQRLKLINPAGQLIALAELTPAEEGHGLAARPIRVLQA